MDISVVFLFAISFLLVLLTSWALCVPFFEGVSAKAEFDGWELDLRRAEILSALEELETDLRSGKILTEEFERAKGTLYQDLIRLDLASHETAPEG